jgi:coproporphyrinogen III oxidase
MYTDLVKEYLLSLQTHICHMLESEEPHARFKEEIWTHTEGGGGQTRLLSHGYLLEKSGVNYSHIHGKQLPSAATDRFTHLNQAGFQAQGVSVVVHPHNPYIPVSHFNVRFIHVEKEGQIAHWWFGGGFDLTPYYGFEEDCIYWHTMAKAACEPFGAQVYANYKKWCDDYFYLKHRKEPRGIGGLFFDDLHEWGFEQCFQFIQSVSRHYVNAYQALIARRKHIAYGEKERAFQAYRRGRYVEFNLLYDRGTLFGLQAGGRTESILMSLPPEVTWPHEKNEYIERCEKELLEFLFKRIWNY